MRKRTPSRQTCLYLCAVIERSQMASMRHLRPYGTPFGNSYLQFTWMSPFAGRIAQFNCCRPIQFWILSSAYLARWLKRENRRKPPKDNRYAKPRSIGPNSCVVQRIIYVCVRARSFFAVLALNCSWLVKSRFHDAMFLIQLSLCFSIFSSKRTILSWH